jgi:hypothetical protein
VSIWSTPLWGKRHDSPPASPIAIRRSRLVAAGGLDVVPWVVFAGILGELIFSGELMLVVLIGTPKSIPRTQAFAAMLDGFMKGIGVLSIALTFGVFALFFLTVRPAARLLFERLTPRMTQAVQQARRRKRRKARRTGAILWAVCLVIFVCAAIFIPPMSTLVVLAKSTAPTGMMLIALGWKARKGRLLVCGRCDYPMGSWRGSPPRCPECNEAWHEPWKARLGQRRMNRALLAGGVVLLAISLTAAILAGNLMQRL